MNFAGKIKSFFARLPAGNTFSPDFFEELSDLLVEGDMGAHEAYAAVELLQKKCKNEKIADWEQVRSAFVCLLEEILASVAAPPLLTMSKDRLTVILLLGVNGVGKTTTAAKLAHWYNNSGVKPVLAAADTFRAAAIDQLKIHGQRLDLRVVAHQQGGDPAAVVYDAIEAAKADASAHAGGMVIADTAGRMHTKSALVEELRKIDRVVELKAGGAEYIKYLALDSTTGRNAYAQAEIFCEAVSPQAAILTKYDSTAKGGVVFSLAQGLGLPVAYLCTGEQYGDIQIFNPHNFVREFAGMD